MKTLILLLAFGQPLVVAPMAGAGGLFGSVERKNHNLAMFSKWTGMWRRAAAEPAAGARLSGDCIPNPRFVCPGTEREALIERLQGQSPLIQLAEVNRSLNRSRYVLDPINWGVPDYWETIGEFLHRNGDCEDYAIAKYIVLKALGIPADQMRIVVVDDLNLGVPHAVLAVALDGANWILDNQASEILPDQMVRHYRPIYSINERAWWLHQS